MAAHSAGVEIALCSGCIARTYADSHQSATSFGETRSGVSICVGEFHRDADELYHWLQSGGDQRSSTRLVDLLPVACRSSYKNWFVAYERILEDLPGQP